MDGRKIGNLEIVIDAFVESFSWVRGMPYCFNYNRQSEIDLHTVK